MKLANNKFYQEGRAPYTKQKKEPIKKWAESFEDRIAALEVELLCTALKENDGNIQFAAEACGLGRSTFFFKMKKYQLNAKGFK